MLDTADLYTAVERVFTCPAKASTEDLSKACRFCATDEESVKAFEGVQDLKGALLGLLEVSLEGRSEGDTCEVDIRRARLALRTLINAVNRSKKFAQSVSTECLTPFRALIRIPELRTETFAALVALAKPMRLICALRDDYTALFGELVLLWEQGISDADRSWLSALVSLHLEQDFGFLANYFADLPCEEFTALLHVIEVLMDSGNGEAITKVHPNNIAFCVNLLGRIVYDFGKGVRPENRLPFVEQLSYAVEIIASAALSEADMTRQLLGRPDAVEVIIDILEAVLDAQWLDENEGIANLSLSAVPDRPVKEMEVRCMRVKTSEQLSALSAAIRDSSMEIRANLKCGAVRAIGNLCSEKPTLRIAAGARGGVLAVLRCARLTENDRPFIVQWSIAALRHLCLGCPENQKFILELDQKPSGIIDRQKFLKELGIEVELDPNTGKLRFKNAPDTK